MQLHKHKCDLLMFHVTYFYISLIYRAEEGVENYKVMFTFFQYWSIYDFYLYLFFAFGILLGFLCCFLYSHEAMHLTFRQHIAMLFVFMKSKQLIHCIELNWNYGEGLAEFVMIIFSSSSPLRGSMCVCPEKPLSVMWSFLSGGRWSWVKTARWNSFFFSLYL